MPTPPYPSSLVSYNRLQQVFCLNWLSNVAGEKIGSAQTLTNFANSAVTQILKDDTVVGLIGNWELVWGPVVVEPNEGAFLQVAANTMFVVRQPGEDGGMVYVVAIAGTNPISPFGWVVEDFNVSQTATWTTVLNNPSVPSDPQALVSQGTVTGINQLQGMVSTCVPLGFPAANTNVTLMECLTAAVTQAPAGPLEVIFTGHSLGGALSATLALFFADQQGTSQTPYNWDPNYRAVVSVLPSAGATPGNTNFAKHYDAVLGSRTNRLWNGLDVIPHAWETDLLQQVPFLYFPYFSSNAALIGLVAATIADASGAATYQQINRQTPPLPGQVLISQLTSAGSAVDTENAVIATLVADLLAVSAHLSGAEQQALQKLIVGILNTLEQFGYLNLPTASSLSSPQVTGTLESSDWNSVQTWLSNLEAEIKGDLNTAWNDIQQAVDKLGTSAAALLKNVMSLIQNDLNSILTALQADLATLLQFIAALFKNVWDFISKLVATGKVAWSDIATQLPGILTFLGQLGIQHVPAYAQLLGVSAYVARQKAIRATLPFLPSANIQGA